MELYFTSGRQWLTVHTFHTYCPILVTCSTADVHIRLLSVCGFGEDRHGEGRTALSGVNEITFVCVSQKCVAFCR